MELSNALANADPKSFCSRIPVHQDGTCNGLQHYAALGRDRSGGETVNLLPGDFPQDIYMEVLGEVKRRVRWKLCACIFGSQTLLLLVSLGR